ncbi:MAG: hypothetical protein AAF676_17345, partial [Pseudomonadota bacterium]
MDAPPGAYDPAAPAPREEALDPRIDPDAHWVSEEAYDAEADLQALDRKDLDASTSTLIWRRFKRNKLAVVSGLYLLLVYLALPFVGFLAPYDPAQRNEDALFAQPSPVDFF